MILTPPGSEVFQNRAVGSGAFEPLADELDEADLIREAAREAYEHYVVPFDTLEEVMAWHVKEMKAEGRTIPENLQEYA